MGFLFIVEDDPERLREIRQTAAEELPGRAIHVEDDCATAVGWLKAHLPEVDLISLDHDMDSVPRAGEMGIDHGCGRDVANYLATMPPTCPVIVHSANDIAATGMGRERPLTGASLPCRP